jgi:CHAD domain-containing protein
VADTQREIESKFDVAPDFALGDLDSLLESGDHLESDTVALVSVYYDTTEDDLLRSRLTLRRRTGTTDTGWHLKVPGAGFRTELRWPLDGNEHPPGDLRRLIQPFTHGTAVEARVRLRVNRRRCRITNAKGDLRFEIADDEVRADALAAPVRTPRWREVEVELGPAGSAADLERAAALLRRRGAFTSGSSSKLARALRGLPLDGPDSDTAAAVLGAYITTQCDAITAGHFAISMKPFEVEAGTPPHEAIHQTRVATRRLRALLRIFADLFEPAPAARLEGELQWFATELGEVRDREVLRVRLAQAVAELPAFLVVGPVAQRIDAVLLAELHQHADALFATMGQPRYHDLIDDLAQWHDHPPFTALAASPKTILAGHVASAERTLTKRMKRAARKQAPDEALHSARKAGKRARYAAEAAEPALGKSAHALAKSAAALQTLLGEHQDSVVATELLRRIADQLADEGANPFTFGILVADQRRTAADSARSARRSARHAHRRSVLTD